MKNWYKNGWKKYISRALNVALVLLVGFTLYKRVPIIWQQWQMQNKNAEKIEVINLQGEKTLLPKPGQKQVLIFWATWCPPCKLELQRVQDLIAAKKISDVSIYAISMGEDSELVKKTIQERGYTFSVLLDPQMQASETYDVTVTPTLIFIDENAKNHWVSSGVSPTLAFRLQDFLGAP